MGQSGSSITMPALWAYSAIIEMILLRHAFKCLRADSDEGVSSFGHYAALATFTTLCTKPMNASDEFR